MVSTSSAEPQAAPPLLARRWLALESVALLALIGLYAAELVRGRADAFTLIIHGLFVVAVAVLAAPSVLALVGLAERPLDGDAPGRRRRHAFMAAAIVVAVALAVAV